MTGDGDTTTARIAELLRQGAEGGVDESKRAAGYEQKHQAVFADIRKWIEALNAATGIAIGIQGGSQSRPVYKEQRRIQPEGAFPISGYELALTASMGGLGKVLPIRSATWAQIHVGDSGELGTIVVFANAESRLQRPPKRDDAWSETAFKQLVIAWLER